MKIIDQKQIKYKYGKFYVSTINEDGGYADLHYEIYASLSDITSPSNKVLYLIGPTGSGEDKYEEYIYSGTEFVKIGDTSIDLSNIHDAFIVEYGVTDFMDIVDAAEAGKTLVALNTGNDDPSVYYVNTMSANGISSSFIFTSFSDDNFRYDFIVDANGYTPITETLLQTALTFDSTPTTNSNNPVTSGGVKTAIDNVDKVFIAEYGVTTYAQIQAQIALGKTIFCKRFVNDNYYKYGILANNTAGAVYQGHKALIFLSQGGYRELENWYILENNTSIIESISFASSVVYRDNSYPSGYAVINYAQKKTTFTLIDNSSGATAESSCSVELGKVYAFTNALGIYTINLPAITDSSTTPATYTAPDVITLHIATGASPNISIVANSLTEPIYHNSGFEFEANTLYEVSLSNANGKWYLAGIEMEEVV